MMLGRIYIFKAIGTLLLCTLILLGCQQLDISKKKVKGSGLLVEENRNISGFSSINLENQGNLYIEIGKSEKFVIKTDDNLMKYIIVKVRSGELYIGTEKDVSLHPSDKLNYYMTVKTLSEINISSSGNVYVPEFETNDFVAILNSSGDLKIDGLKAGYVKINSNSSGDMNLKMLRAKKIKVNINSSGDLNISSGGVESQDISINSSGNYNADNLASDEASVTINSSGDANIYVRDYLSVTINSSGDLIYSGKPRVTKRLSSSGTIKQIGSPQ